MQYFIYIIPSCVKNENAKTNDHCLSKESNNVYVYLLAYNCKSIVRDDAKCQFMRNVFRSWDIYIGYRHREKERKKERNKSAFKMFGTDDREHHRHDAKKE